MYFLVRFQSHQCVVLANRSVINLHGRKLEQWEAHKQSMRALPDVSNLFGRRIRIHQLLAKSNGNSKASFFRLLLAADGHGQGLSGVRLSPEPDRQADDLRLLVARLPNVQRNDGEKKTSFCGCILQFCRESWHREILLAASGCLYLCFDASKRRR